MRYLLIISLLLIAPSTWAQKYISQGGTITFFSEAPLENIKATNQKASSILDLTQGEIVFSVPIKEFQFRKALMQQHFNENYMDSDTYPKSYFKGSVRNYEQKNGKYRAVAQGELTIRGKTNPVQVEGDLSIHDDTVTLFAKFPVTLEDYAIKRPKILFSNIAEVVEVTIEFQYKPYASN